MKKLLLVWFLFSAYAAAAQQPALNQEILDYIDKYSGIAVSEMKKHGIPASITLAQGVFESGWGKSKLSTQSNNHFGIKCKADWNGGKVYHDDDAPQECFRQYESVEHSYADHSKFLKESPRYAFLFKLDITDYKGWAEGLKKAGYATNPQYAARLINLIELYELYEYDHGRKPHRPVAEKSHKKEEPKKQEVVPPPVVKAEPQPVPYGMHKGREIFLCNRSKYVVARPGDTWDLLAVATGKSVDKLYRFNDITDPSYVITPGERIYISKKQKKSGLTELDYTAQEGETLHSISQRLGMRVDVLCDLNSLFKFEKLPQGKVIKLK